MTRISRSIAAQVGDLKLRLTIAATDMWTDHSRRKQLVFRRTTRPVSIQSIALRWPPAAGSAALSPIAQD